MLIGLYYRLRYRNRIFVDGITEILRLIGIYYRLRYRNMGIGRDVGQVLVDRPLLPLAVS